MKGYILGFLLTGYIAFISGCAGYGKLDLISNRGEALTIQELIDRWQEYEIYYSGRVDDPSAVLFERRNQDRKLTVSDRWSKAEDKATVRGLVKDLQIQPPTGGYYPWLRVILGPDNYAYGYMFTAWDHAVMKMIDDKTMYVYDMPLSPYRTKGADFIWQEP